MVKYEKQIIFTVSVFKYVYSILNDKISRSFLKNKTFRYGISFQENKNKIDDYKDLGTAIGELNRLILVILFYYF